MKDLNGPNFKNSSTVTMRFIPDFAFECTHKLFNTIQAATYYEHGIVINRSVKIHHLEALKDRED
jgi:hypothetical protein